MDRLTAEALAKKIQISPDYIVREEYEMIILKEIYESEFGQNLVFKGGTALRLAYGSPRFSDDLDFDLISELDKKKYFEFLKGVGQKYPGIVSVEANEKHYTLFALVKIKVEYLKQPFSIKVEVSKRVKKSVAGKDYLDQVIKSEVALLTAFARVASLEAILRGKKDALRNRKAVRDVFDFWFLNKLLKKETKLDFSGYDQKEVNRDLHKLLPRPYWRFIQ